MDHPSRAHREESAILAGGNSVFEFSFCEPVDFVMALARPDREVEYVGSVLHAWADEARTQLAISFDLVGYRATACWMNAAPLQFFSIESDNRSGFDVTLVLDVSAAVETP